MALQKRAKKAFDDPNETRFQFTTPGDVAEGYYVGKEEFTANGDDLTKFKIKHGVNDPKTITFLGNTVLQDLITDEDEGTWIQVTYIGLKKSKKGREYKDFEVATDPDKRLTA